MSHYSKCANRCTTSVSSVLQSFRMDAGSEWGTGGLVTLPRGKGVPLPCRAPRGGRNVADTQCQLIATALEDLAATLRLVLPFVARTSSLKAITAHNGPRGPILTPSWGPRVAGPGSHENTPTKSSSSVPAQNLIGGAYDGWVTRGAVHLRGLQSSGRRRHRLFKPWRRGITGHKGAGQYAIDVHGSSAWHMRKLAGICWQCTLEYPECARKNCLEDLEIAGNLPGIFCPYPSPKNSPQPLAALLGAPCRGTLGTLPTLYGAWEICLQICLEIFLRFQPPNIAAILDTLDS